MNDVDLTNLFVFLTFGVFAAAVVLAFLLVKKSNDQLRQSEMNVNGIMARLPQDKQMLFMMQYNNVKKNPTTALLLALFLGGVGAHKFYVGNSCVGFLYLLFCWTYIPAIVSFIEAFTISGNIGKYNEQKAIEIAAMMGGTF